MRPLSDRDTVRSMHRTPMSRRPQGSPAHYGLLAALCMAACSSSSGGDLPPASTEHVGTVASPLTYAQLHVFSGSATDGASPVRASPLLLNGVLYGMTYNGGTFSTGTVFKVNPDGTGFSLLHSFSNSDTTDGTNPYGSLVGTGTTLYGETINGGASGTGALFKIATDGTGFTLLHSFAGGAADGSQPRGTPVLSGTTLYGTTGMGGSSGAGTVFKIATDGTGFALLHSFAGGATDGASAFGTAMLSGTTLYGMTTLGGASSVGTVYKVNTDGTGFALLHTFTGSATDGKYPLDGLAIAGGVLYGLTSNGGTSNAGVAFKVNVDGTGFAILHSFAGGVTGGSSPSGSPTLVGSMLYGTTIAGGTANAGTVFKMNIDGTSFALARSFAGGTTDGANLDGSLIASGSTFYGMSSAAGSAANGGTVFKLTIACGADEHVATNVCVACASGTARTAGDDPAGADTACAAPVIDAGTDASDASVPAPDGGAAPTPDGGAAPTPDGGAAPGSADTSAPGDSGCTTSSSRSNGESTGGLAAFAALAIVGLCRRRRRA